MFGLYVGEVVLAKEMTCSDQHIRKSWLPGEEGTGWGLSQEDQAGNLEKCKGRWWPEAVTVGMGEAERFPRGRLWYLMQLDQQGRRLTTGAGGRLIPSSSSFRKLASLIFGRRFLSSIRTACVLLVILGSISSFTPRILLFFL